MGQGAGAVVSAGLGVVSLTGSWMGTVAAARETLVGQLQTSSSASVAKQIQAVYGDAWQATALWGGVFALAALLVGVVVLARPRSARRAGRRRRGSSRPPGRVWPWASSACSWPSSSTPTSCSDCRPPAEPGRTRGS